MADATVLSAVAEWWWTALGKHGRPLPAAAILAYFWSPFNTSFVRLNKVPWTEVPCTWFNFLLPPF